MATIPLQVASRRLDVASAPQYPTGGAIGQAMQDAGSGLQDVAFSMQRKQQQRDAFQADREREGLAAAANNLIQQSVANAPADGAGLHDGVIGKINPETGQLIKPGEFDKLAADVLQRVPASQRAQFEAELPAMRLRISGKLAAAQNGIEQDYYKLSIAGIHQNLLNEIVQADPSDKLSIEQFTKRGLDAIAKSPLQPLAKMEATQIWQQSAAETTYQAWLAKDPEAPAKAANALGFGHAMDGSIPPEGAALLDTIASVESAGQYDIINGGERFSSYADHPKKGQRGSVGIAAGRYQDLPSTWERIQAATGVPDFSPKSQDIGNWWLAQADYKANTGRDLLTDLRSKDANVQAGIRRALSSTWEGLKHVGDGQFAAKIAKGPTSTGADPRFAAIPADKRYALLRQANSQGSQNEALYTNGLSDYISALRDGHGNDTAGQYSPESLISHLPPDKATTAQGMIDQARAYGADKNALAFASPDEVKSIFAARTAALDTPGGYRQAATDLSGLQTVLQARDKAILSDPAAYVAQQPAVAAAFKDMARNQQDPQAARVYATSTLAEQSRLGVPAAAQRILPATMTADIVARFNDQKSGSQNAASQMVALENQFGKYWPQVFGELAATKQLPGAALVIGAMNRPDQAKAREELAAAAQIGTTDLEKLVSKDTRDSIIARVDTNLAPFAATLTNNGVGGTQTLLAFREAAYQLALQYGRNEDPNRAADRAYTDIIGRAYTLEDTYRVPIEQNATAVSDGAAAAISQFDGAGVILPASPYSEETTRLAYARQVQAHGFWVTSGDESGLTLYDETGTAVRNADGSPVSYTWAELSTSNRGAPLGKAVGLVQPGNIDLSRRPMAQNPDGSISTVRSMSFEEDGKEILIPTVSPDGKILSDQEAIDLYHRTGQHLGVFDNAANASAYAEKLHKAQEQFYSRRAPYQAPFGLPPVDQLPGLMGAPPGLTGAGEAPVGGWSNFFRIPSRDEVGRAMRLEVGK